MRASLWRVGIIFGLVFIIIECWGEHQQRLTDQTGWKMMTARQQGSCGLRLALPGLMGLFLLCIFALTCADGGDNETRSHPDVVPGQDPPEHGHPASPKKAFPVLSFNYDNVRKPFEISMWILLALLMKLGEWRVWPQHRSCSLLQMLLKPEHCVFIDKKYQLHYICMWTSATDSLTCCFLIFHLEAVTIH